MKKYISVIGGGLAGSEAAYQIAKRGIKVKLYEMKPKNFSEAHSNEDLAEIVCSNSFKSNLYTNACGLLKQELRKLGSLLIQIADKTALPAGQALAVDRTEFAKKVTKKLEKMKNIEIIRKEVGGTLVNNVDDILINKTEKSELEEMARDGIVIVSTGPLTSNKLSKDISNLTGQDKLYFYDASAPIVERNSVNMEIAFWGERYRQEIQKDEDIKNWKSRIKSQNGASYINIPMNKQEYEIFWTELVNAKTVELHDFEKKELFEGCIPIEIIAKRGKDTLRFGPLKPVGFTDPRTIKRPYAVVQLRQDNTQGNLFNLVGFQTNLKFGEQQKVFSKIPGLENAEFVKYGVMHRNTFINSTILLDDTYNLKSNSNIYFAGQITGVEGYVESISSGMVAGLNAIKQFENIKKQSVKNGKERINDKIIFPKTTMIGALAKYISTPNREFQPMNANFGILPKLDEKIKDKKLKYSKLADRALNELDRFILQ